MNSKRAAKKSRCPLNALKLKEGARDCDRSGDSRLAWGMFAKVLGARGAPRRLAPSIKD